MNRFDRDTALERVGEREFEGRLDDGWWIVAGPNGGYIAALVLRAMMLTVDEAARAPRSVTFHFLRPPGEGPVQIRTEVERAGRSVTTVTARLFQNDKLMVLAVGAFGFARDAFEFADITMPDAPPPEQCELLRDRMKMTVRLQERYESRVVSAGAPNSGTVPAEFSAWIRLAEPRTVDAIAVAAYSDALPPPAFVRGTNNQSVGPIPTIDLTVHFRTELPLPDASPDDHYLCSFESRMAGNGYVEEDGMLWSPGGVLVAQSRQLSLLAGPVRSG